MIRSVSLVSLLLAAGTAGAGVDNATLPEPVRVPSGHMVKLETLGVGEITYECSAKKDAPGEFAWAFVAPVATLYDMQNKIVGKYYGGPTWEAMDGSRITGKQVAVAPAMAPKSIPLQLVKADPATGMGALTGVTFIQRLDTSEGVAPTATCEASMQGWKQQVPYQAKYVFYTQN